MFKTPPASRLSSPERPTFVDTPVHRSSRRLLGLSPEFSALSGTRSARGPQAMASANAAQVTFQQPREPNCFHGEAFEDVDDWLDHFERVARFNQWNNNNKLHNVYFSLKDGAETWFLNNEASMQTWEEFREKLLETFSSTDRCDHAMRLLDSRIQKPNESVAMFAEDMARLFKRADPAMAEAKKLRYLMNGVKEQLFAGLVRNPPQTVQAFIKEATAIERALQERSRQYNRHTNHASSNVAMLSTVNERDLRDLVRTIVQEELRKLKVSSPEPVIASAFSIAEIVREELRQTLVTPEHSVEAPQCCRDMILGMDFLREHGAVINIRDRSVIFSPNATPVSVPKATTSRLKDRISPTSPGEPLASAFPSLVPPARDPTRPADQTSPEKTRSRRHSPVQFFGMIPRALISFIA
ncbi:uncharacterized protein LOC144165723 [Haemaphysalis longicornis]